MELHPGVKNLYTNLNVFPWGSGWVGQLVRLSFRHAKVVGLILGLGTYKKQPMNA